MRHWRIIWGSKPGFAGASIGTVLVTAALSFSCERSSPPPGDGRAAPGVVVAPGLPSRPITLGSDASTPRPGWVPPIARDPTAAVEAIRRGDGIVESPELMARGEFYRARIRIERGSSPPIVSPYKIAAA